MSSIASIENFKKSKKLINTKFHKMLLEGVYNNFILRISKFLSSKAYHTTYRSSCMTHFYFIYSGIFQDKYCTLVFLVIINMIMAFYCN